MKLIHLPLIAVGVGVFLIVLSFVWPDLIGTRVWTEQQAREHSEASAQLHRLSHEHAHAAEHEAGSDREQRSALLQAAKQRYERSKAELQRAKSLRLRTATFLKWTGTVCLLLGAAAYFFLLRSAAG